MEDTPVRLTCCDAAELQGPVEELHRVAALCAVVLHQIGMEIWPRCGRARCLNLCIGRDRLGRELLAATLARFSVRIGERSLTAVWK